jgi:hypothetical protein
VLILETIIVWNKLASVINEFVGREGEGEGG